MCSNFSVVEVVNRFLTSTWTERLSDIGTRRDPIDPCHPAEVARRKQNVVVRSHVAGLGRAVGRSDAEGGADKKIR